MSQLLHNLSNIDYAYIIYSKRNYANRNVQLSSSLCQGLTTFLLNVCTLFLTNSGSVRLTQWKTSFIVFVYFYTYIYTYILISCNTFIIIFIFLILTSQLVSYFCQVPFYLLFPWTLSIIIQKLNATWGQMNTTLLCFGTNLITSLWQWIPYVLLMRCPSEKKGI